MKGQCLCGEVKFEIDGELQNLYQCHCSLCRKTTGAAANAATFVPENTFRWVSGQKRITSFTKPSGFRSDFCSVCGSPVPNPLRNTDKFWIPAGLLDDDPYVAVSVHLHLDSAASWERDEVNCQRLPEGPSGLDSLNKALQRTSR